MIIVGITAQKSRSSSDVHTHLCRLTDSRKKFSKDSKPEKPLALIFSTPRTFIKYMEFTGTNLKFSMHIEQAKRKQISFSEKFTFSN